MTLSSIGMELGDTLPELREKTSSTINNRFKRCYYLKMHLAIPS